MAIPFAWIRSDRHMEIGCVRGVRGNMDRPPFSENIIVSDTDRGLFPALPVLLRRIFLFPSTYIYGELGHYLLKRVA